MPLTPKAEDVLKLAARIASLRSNLQDAESALERVLNQPYASVGAPPDGSGGAEPDAERSLNTSIMDLLLIAHPEDMNGDELLGQLPPDTNVRSVRSALVRLAKEGRICRTGRGRYASTESPAQRQASRSLKGAHG